RVRRCRASLLSCCHAARRHERRGTNARIADKPPRRLRDRTFAPRCRARARGVVRSAKAAPRQDRHVFLRAILGSLLQVTKKEGKEARSIAQNRKARFDYFIEERLEAGLALQGWEVKSMRAGKAQLTDSFVILRDGEA